MAFQQFSKWYSSGHRIIKELFLVLNQCDQMARLLFQYLALDSPEDLLKIIIFCSQTWFTISTNTKWTSEKCQRHKFLPTWRYFAWSGHTGKNVVGRYLLLKKLLWKFWRINKGDNCGEWFQLTVLFELKKLVLRLHFR